MHGEPHAVAPAAAGDSALVVIARGWGGARALVPTREIHGLHVAVTCGGRVRRLPHPMLAGYVLCTSVVGQLDHDCVHGPPPHRIKVVIPRRGNETVYDGLWNRAGLVHERR